MVSQPPRPATPGSSQGQFTIVFEKQPPGQVRPGAKFTMPVVVKVEPTGPQEPNPNLGLSLNVLLKNEDGSDAAGGILSGQRVDSIYSEDGDTLRGRVAFSDLRISQAGRYRFCVVLNISDLENGVTEAQQITEDVVIDVNETAPENQVPSKILQRQKSLFICIDTTK